MSLLFYVIYSSGATLSCYDVSSILAACSDKFRHNLIGGKTLREKKTLPEPNILEPPFLPFVWQDMKMCMKRRIWPFETRSGGKCLYSVCRISRLRQKNHSCLISISEHKGKCPSSLERNHLPAFENPLGKARRLR